MVYLCEERKEGYFMAEEWAVPFYNSTLWKKQRKYILQRDNFMCTEVGCHRPATEVHHIIELSKDNINDSNITLNENNLRSLCHDCHTRITSEMKSGCFEVLPRIVFDDKGYPIVGKA